MKKIVDNKFLFIVALSLIVLIVLGIGAFYLFDDSDATFVKNGYVLNPLSAKNEKYFFNENTSYKENLSAMIEFKDVDNVDVTILKESFIHYMDGSMSFLKNGAILDLNSIEGTKAVDFYNITNKSLIEKDGKGYTISAKNGDINLKNFIGRISDDKYIVAGNLEAKIPGNNTNIKGDYFEVVYTEEGIINIENKDNKFQVTAEGTIIYAGDVIIDLGNKKITKNGEDVMSITAITIDGNENIEIIPKAEPSASSASDDNGGAGNNQTPDAPSQNEPEPIIDNDGDGVPDPIVVNLKNVETGSTYANLLFDIKNTTGEDSFSLKVTNLDTGRTVQKEDNVNPNRELSVEGLTPGTKYLFTLENSKDGGKYSQKLIETKGFGINFERSYVTDDSLGYKITVSEDSDVRDATISLMQYNEASKKLEPVKTTYIDGEGNEITRELTYNLSNFEDGIKGTHEVSFDGMLKSNTLYTAVLKNVAIGGGNYESYDKSLTDLTLKKTPDYTNLNAIEGIDKKSFKLEIGGIVDPDNAIVSYTYRIYEKTNLNTPVINEIVRNDASPIEVPFGNCENCLKNDDDGKHKYVYRVVIKYFDNEKEVDFITSDSFSFSMGTDPYVTVVPDDRYRSYNSIGGKVYILDNSCTIAMPGRPAECEGVNSARVRISYDSGSGKQTYLILDEEQCGFTATANEIMCEFNIDGLAEGTKYYVDVWAVRQDHNIGVAEEIEHTSDSIKYIKTKSLSEFSIDWNLTSSQAKSNSENVIYIDPKLVKTEDDDSQNDYLSPGETAAAIQKVKIQLYEDDDVSSVSYGLKEPIASFIVNGAEENIKENFYDERYLITLSKFGLTYDPETNSLISNDNRSYKLKEYYTLSVSAYYDRERTVSLSNSVVAYKVSPLLFIDDLGESLITAAPIRNDENRGVDHDLINNYLNNTGTVIGYTVTPSFDRQGLAGHNFTPEKIRYYVKDTENNLVDFYVVEGNNVKRVSYLESTDLDNLERNIYMTYGSDYASSDDDNIMRRGETYYIGFSLGIDLGQSSVENGTGAWTKQPLTATKDEASIVMYPYTSNENSITYKYSIKDPDKTIYKNVGTNKYSFYYVVNDANEKSIALTDTSGAYNSFAGNDLTLTGLSKDDVYKLYYKRALTLGGGYDNDVSSVYVAESENGRLFDGIYDADDYDFSYEVINSQENDNRVAIKILAEDEVLDRIVAYKVNLTSNQGNYDRDDLILQECDDGSYRCLMIDYIDIKRLKSEIGHENKITVSVKAFYDTGLTGFGFEVGDKYMIFQNNNANGEMGRYVSFSSRGIITNWVHDINVPKGVYRYSFVNDPNRDIDNISYESMLDNNYDTSFNYVIDQNGYKALGVSIGTLNPKKVVDYDMLSTNNTFSFYSITPTISINYFTRVINGAVINMNLANIDEEGLKDFCDSTSGRCVSDPRAEKYIYIETWASESDAEEDTDFSRTVRRPLKVSLNSDPRNPVDAPLFLLNNDTTYYYRVYAYLNKDNDSVYTQLFHNGKEKRTYSFKTLASGDVFKPLIQDENNRPLDYVVNNNPNANYSDKLLKTTISLEKYKNSVPFNYDLGYVLCDISDDNCGISDASTYIFKKVIDKDTLIEKFLDSDKYDDMVDFIEYGLEDLVFGKQYRVNMYAIFDYYDKSTGNTIKKSLLINRQNNVYSLRKLDKPGFTATRKASYDSVNDDYVIDISVVVDDKSRVLNDGKYYVKLLDTTENKNITGILQVKDGGNWRTIGEGSEYVALEDFKILNVGEDIRISGLPNPNTSYELLIYNTAYFNNADEEDPNKYFEKSYAVYTSEFESNVAFGNLSLATTESSLELRFIGGSNLVERVCSLDCTIKEIDANNREVNSYPLSYIVPGDREFDEDTGNWRFIVSGGGLAFNETSTYNAKIVIKTCDPVTHAEEKTFEIERTDITYAEGQN